MNKQEFIDLLNARLTEVLSYPDNAQFQHIAFFVKELPKCPKCGEYEGKNFTIFDFLFTVMDCKSCGYHYSEY